MELYLIRHGQSVNNSIPDEERTEDPSLTDIGHRQAEHLAEWIAEANINRLITSPFRRTLETTEYIRKITGLTPDIWTDLHEQGGCVSGHPAISYDGRPGMSASEISNDYPDYLLPPDIDHRGWWKSKPYETIPDAHLRAERVVRRSREELSDDDERIAFVMHGTFKRILVGTFFETPVSEKDWLGEIYNTAVTKIDLSNGTTRLVCYNIVGHLPLPLVT